MPYHEGLVAIALTSALGGSGELHALAALSSASIVWELGGSHSQSGHSEG
jgi:hypothetical protein